MVKSDKSGIIHAYAQCNNCEWDSVIRIDEDNRMQKLRNRIYSHVSKTKHRVTLETGNSTIYYFED
jgi:hypothetical protein